MGDPESQENSLHTLGIPWKGSPRLWNTIPRNLLHICTIQGTIVDASGIVLYTLRPVGPLGAGTFGSVSGFRCVHMRPHYFQTGAWQILGDLGN